MRNKVRIILVLLVAILAVFVFVKDIEINKSIEEADNLTITKVYYQSLNSQSLIIYNDNKCSYQGVIYRCYNKSSLMKVDDIIFYKSGREYVYNNFLLLTKASFYKMRDSFNDYKLSLIDELGNKVNEKIEISDIKSCVNDNGIVCTIVYNLKPTDTNKYLDINHNIGWINSTEQVRFDKFTKTFVEIVNGI